jgi:hypothetical protein
MTGIAAGVASNSRNPVVRMIAVLIGYALAVTLHALWNASASLHEGEAFIGVYAFIMLPLFLAMIAIVVWQRRREQRIVIEQLPGFAQAGWIAPSEIALLSSLAGRRGWRAAVRRRSGKRVAKAVTDYQAAVTDLAFLRSRMSRGSVGNETGMFWHGEALSELARSRDRAIGHPEALTMALRHHSPADWTPPPPGPPPGPPGPPPGVPQSYPAPPWPGPGPPPSWPGGPSIRPVTPPGPPGSSPGWPTPPGRREAPHPGSRSGSHPGSIAPPGRPDHPPGPGMGPSRYPPPATGAGVGPGTPPGPNRPGGGSSPGSFSDQPTRRITVRRSGEPSADKPPAPPVPGPRADPTADDDSPTTRR